MRADNYKRRVNRFADRRIWPFFPQIADFGDKISGFADLKSTLDRGSADKFGPDSGLCMSRSSDYSQDWIINFRFALLGILVFFRLFYFQFQVFTPRSVA